MLLSILIASGCASLPRGRTAVDSVDVEGAAEVSASDVKKKIVTRKTPKFLGLFRGVVYDYEIFDLFVLQRDLARVERYYRARGFYKARARAGRVFYEDDQHARVEIHVEEGPPTLVERLQIAGIEQLEPELRELVVAAAEEHVAEGERFEEEKFEDAEKAILKTLTDEGYAWAEVKRSADVELPRDRARVRFDVVPWVPATYGEIDIVGVGDLPEDEVRNALLLEPGDPYSTEDIADARQAVLDLGVFSSVEIQPKLVRPPPPSRRVPLTVKVEPSKLHTVKLGAGIELDVIRTDFHLIAGWEHRNFLGGMRRFTVDFRPGIVFYPTRLPDFQAPTHYLPEEKLRVELRQPGFIEGRIDLFVRGEFNIYPVLISPDINPDAPVIGYREAKGSVGVDRRFWRLYARPSYNAQYNTPFAYAGVLDSALKPLFISHAALFMSLDYRDDPVRPHRGVLLSNEIQSAGGPLGGDARDIKLQPDLRVFVPLGDDLTLGLRGSVGLLLPKNYGSTIADNAEGRRPPPGVSREDWARDVQISFFRAFFSGGPSSNRGYPMRGIGPHGVIPFFEPTVAAQQLADDCTPSAADFDESRCELPLGGLTLWEAAVELRYPLAGPLDATTFCDGSDVAPRELEFRFDRPHLSCGLGARYGTPIGPIRVDIGYRIPGLQVLGTDEGEGTPPTIFGVPVAVHLGIGEAF